MKNAEGFKFMKNGGGANGNRIPHPHEHNIAATPSQTRQAVPAPSTTNYIPSGNNVTADTKLSASGEHH
jgi:hypothetical protein